MQRSCRLYRRTENRSRYILALGLRTLTLQTGDEYRERIHLDRNDLAVLIGSSAVTKLHEENKEADKGKEKKGNKKGVFIGRAAAAGRIGVCGYGKRGAVPVSGYLLQ